MNAELQQQIAAVEKAREAWDTTRAEEQSNPQWAWEAGDRLAYATLKLIRYLEQGEP